MQDKMKIYNLFFCFFVFKSVLNKGNVIRFRIKIGDVVK